LKLPEPNNKSLSTTGLAGIVLMTIHLTSYVTGWGWPILYIFLIISGIGQENRRPTWLPTE